MFPDIEISSHTGRAFLRDELIKRCRSNPKYSLRAFARRLEIEPAALSKILSGKRNLTPQMAERIAEKLNLSPQDATKLIHDMKPSEEPELTFIQLTEENFNLVSHWMALTVLELVATRGFRGDARWIAKRLVVPVVEVQAICTTLIKRGLLEIDTKGQWVDRSGNFSTLELGSFAAVANIRLQLELLQRAQAALEEVPIELRDQTGLTFALDKRKLNELRKRIAKFRRETSAWLQNAGVPDEVYQLSISLFPLTVVKKRRSRDDDS